jgi:PIN domain nuclease of toxin-antitoxin system
MKVLIDTHVFLWGLTQQSRLSEKIRALLPVSDVWISVASVWEIVTKVQIGKLSLPDPVGPYIRAQFAANGVSVLPILLDHVLRIQSMQLHHRDPFDRILIAQSLEESLPIVTSDPQFEKYPVELIW